MAATRADAGIDAALRGCIDGGALAGCVASAANRDGVFYTRALGQSDRNLDVPLRTDSLFRIASMTKAVTSVAVMQLVERGALSLDDAASDHVSELADARVLEGFGDNGTPRLRAPASAPSVRQLLSHTAGFAYEMWNEDITRFHASTGTPSIFAGGDGFLGAPLASDPGTRWEYSLATDWLGILVERVSGETLDAYLHRNVFEPLGMTDTGFDPNKLGIDRLVAVQHRLDDGTLQQAPQPKPGTRNPFLSGGAGLFSTAADYLRFARMLLRGGELDGARVLAAETVVQMARSHTGALTIDPMPTCDTGSSNDVDFFPGAPKSFGLGFLINDADLNGRRASGSLSWAGLFNSYYWIDVRSGVCGVVLMQLLPFFDAGAVALYDAFERAVYATLREG
jgi:methyl acetate hydrolase